MLLDNEAKHATEAALKDRIEKLERLVLTEVKTRILNDEALEKLVRLVNEELDSAHSAYSEKLDSIDTELKEVGVPAPSSLNTEETPVLPIASLSGAGGIRTPYLFTASETFSRLNYSPVR